MNRGMNNVWSLVARRRIVYGVLRVAMGVFRASCSRTRRRRRAAAAHRRAGSAAATFTSSEGCAYCHTPERAAAATRSGLRAAVGRRRLRVRNAGTASASRNGPDLRISARVSRATAWQYIHLWDPRASCTTRSCRDITWLFEVKAARGTGRRSRSGSARIRAARAAS